MFTITLNRKVANYTILFLFCYSGIIIFLKSNPEKVKKYYSQIFVEDFSYSVFDKIKSVSNCIDNFAKYKFEKRGDYLVLYNYVLSLERYGCEESVTYATHGDYRFLDNLIPLVKRWKGPISIALHASGSDFNSTLQSILYLRSCKPLIKKYVNFHIYFLDGHKPSQIPAPEDINQIEYNCSIHSTPYENVNQSSTYAAQKKLIYPVNLGRNIARQMSETYYVLTSDIELYPSPNIIQKFLSMVAENYLEIKSYVPAVFPLAVFEIEKGVSMPNNKTELQNLLKNKLAIPFHKNVCYACHAIPNDNEWMEGKEGFKIKVFHAAKRVGKHRNWEPFYIGTKADPEFDERLSWEGMQDKIVQAYTLCLLDYSFLILDNAFLVHRPGIKKSTSISWRGAYMGKTQKLISSVIRPELRKLYGNKPECVL